MSNGEMKYREAGVDLEAAERSMRSIGVLVQSTVDARTLSQVGGFGGLYVVPEDVVNPILVSSTDGVGTKIKLAFMTGVHDTIGRDIVNHCVNDILVQGAHPLFFLDYLGLGKLDEEVVVNVVRGVAEACKENGCALLGGETAELPDLYSPGEYDLAGFIVGVVGRDALLDGSRIEKGDVLVGHASSGLHTNGYTLARHIVFDVMGLSHTSQLPGTGRTVAEELMTVHRSYLPALIDPLCDDSIKGLAHITGGGIPGNLKRVLPDGLGAVIDRSTWEVPLAFRILQKGGDITTEEMDRVFNMGIGMIAVVEEHQTTSVISSARQKGVDAWVIGEISGREGIEYR
ncbi:MAG TPA: phosphoribosylformylglycinamidine cyclo-ligase [Gemmatimonadetes bacterium]|nr:phosphoribosylformylglycinamidine cyclo-ligase [Gemmatimonadota bacterium]HIB10039.1 phosphoribosylformylglycinamidine cyclo-ligase [Gemmatimonadota bacterium]HIC14899.1 phosphoribosylformylglycinamidine cyclo-ligase [Gemmatimonadota bacterium]HIN78716.1 phosphoribosylformylglycinamidine cyclo-ligase [Gemmatimonadota bacterium]